MIFAPKPLGNRKLRPDVLEEDKKNCQKIGPCGIGKEALYLNSFYIDRHYYVTWTDVRRCFKRVAMSRGGYSGKGIFGSIPYLVVQMSNGQEKQCNFKREDDVDRILAEIAKQHPEVPTHSKAAEQRLRRAEAEEEARYMKTLSPAAAAAVEELNRARDFLEEKPEIGNGLSAAAKRKRSVDGIKKSNFALAVIIMAAAVAALVFGIYEIASGNAGSGWPTYLVLFGVAGMFFVAAAGILPTAKKNKKSVQRDWDAAVKRAEEYLEGYPGSAGSDRLDVENTARAENGRNAADGAAAVADTDGAVGTEFPVPAQYAHVIVLDRMIRIIREGKTDNTAEAFELMKEELRSLDHTKKVSQKEYDEVVAVKPMFIVCDYR